MLIDFRQLFPKFNLSFTKVIHIGANVGEEAPVYHELGFKKQVWVEANPELIPQLEANISKYPFSYALNFAAGNENKKITLHISNNHSQSSSVLDLGLHKNEHPDVHYIRDVEVNMYRMEEILEDDDYKDTLLNIDVQGFELNVLKGFGGRVGEFKALYLEVNKSELYIGCALIEDLDAYLRRYGFERVETYWARNKSWGDALYIKSQQKI